MNITLVLAVFNKLDLTEKCYDRIRKLYPDVPLVISSGGSTDGTKEWLIKKSEEDDYLSIFHDDERLTFSDNYNTAIKIADTEKIVLIHNDMIIGEGFLETIERLLKPNMVLSYTTIEPPIFEGHERRGKVIMNLGNGFDDFIQNEFDTYVIQNNKNDNIYDGAVFFMSGYRDMFLDVGLFDGYSFNPAFCEDDDFLIRAKLKGYDLKTTDSAIVYHFVSQTSRFSDEYRDKKTIIENNSNRNFIRKWGTPIRVFHQMKYWLIDNFDYKKISMSIELENKDLIYTLEPYFDKLILSGQHNDYIEFESKNTNYDIRSKFYMIEDVQVLVKPKKELDQLDLKYIELLRLTIANYEPGFYEIGNLEITKLS